MSSTVLTVPKDTTYKLPQGRYKAIITQYKTKDIVTAKCRTSNATILFEVFVPKLEDFECSARKVLPADLKTGSTMRRFLEGLLGPNYFKSKSNQAIDLREILVGQLCEVELVHAKHDEDKFDFPLVDVESVYPREVEKEAETKK